MQKWIISAIVLWTSIPAFAQTIQKDSTSIASALSLVRWSCSEKSSSWWLAEELYAVYSDPQTQSAIRDCEKIRTSLFDRLLEKGIFIFEPQATRFHSTSSKDSLKTQIKKALELYPAEFYLFGAVDSRAETVSLELEFKSASTHRVITSFSRKFHLSKAEKSLSEEDLATLTQDFLIPTRKSVEENRHKLSHYSLEIQTQNPKVGPAARLCLTQKLSQGETIELRTIQKKTQVYAWSSKRSLSEAQSWIKRSTCLTQVSWTIKNLE